VVYEALPLFLMVTTLREGVVLLVLTVLMGPIINNRPPMAYNDWMAMSGFWMIWLVYLPCLVMVLRRPNVAPANDPFARALEQVREFFGRRSVDLERDVA